MNEHKADGPMMLEEAVRIVQENGYTVLCSRYRQTELQRYAEVHQQLGSLQRRRNLQREQPARDLPMGKPGQPPSVERVIARKNAILGSPYVLALYIAKAIAEHFGPMTSEKAKKLKRAFDLEYRNFGVEPPVAPAGWWRYSFDAIEEAGWPDGWLHGWTPGLCCGICGEVVELVDGGVFTGVMNGPYGWEKYPLHPSCAGITSESRG